MKKNKLTTKYLRHTFTFQHDQSDCGVACLSSVIRYYGGSCSLENLRELSGTNRQGTTLLGLYQAANQTGFKAEGCEADIPSLIAHNQPAILHIVQNKVLNHYVVCYGFDKGRFIIGDPANGIVHYTEKELEQVWQSKTCLTLSPDDTFVKISKKSKKQWFFSLLSEDKELLIYSILLGIVMAVLGMSMAVFSQKLIDNIIPSSDIKKLIAGIVLLTFLLLTRVALDAIRNLLIIRQTCDFNNRITDRFYASLLSLPKPFFDTRRTGELMARLNDTQRIQRVIASIIGNIVIDALTAIVSFAFLLYYSWQIGLIALISLLFYFVLIYTFNNRIIKAQREVMQSYALSQSNYVVSMQGIAEIKNNNRIAFFRKLNQLFYGDYQEKMYQLGGINIKLSTLSGIFSILFLMAILGYSSFLVLSEQLKIGELMAILGISGSLLPTVSGLALITIPINEANVAFDRMYEFASLKPEEKGNITDIPLHSLEIRNIAFRFAGRKLLLKDISLSIKKGECIAIIGESGCGKSSFIQILQKFYSFESGKITINESIQLADVKTEHWRNIIGVIPQDITIFNGNILDNILMGEEYKPGITESFFSSYNFSPFIQSLPQGYATILGEEGINLSGGQKQMIALMRVLYRKPQLLILDEFTSGMDRESEKFALQLLNTIKSEIAIIFISHRLYSIKNIADRIYIFSEGTIPLYGTHEQLLQTSNFYSDFWNHSYHTAVPMERPI